jgi:hypothetical protein
MAKAAGARTHLVHGEGVLQVTWYQSIGDMIRGLEKNTFGPAANYRFSRQLTIVVVLWFFAVTPAISLITGFFLSDPLLLGVGGLAFLATLVVSLLMPRRNLHEVFAYLLMPVGVLLLSGIMLRAAYLCLRNDGIQWRGTHYRLADLRAGQRVRM